MNQFVDKSELSAILEASRNISSILDPSVLLENVIDSVIKIMGAERGFLMLYNGKEFQVKVARNINQETIDSASFQFSRGVLKEVEKTGKPILTTNASNDPRFQERKSVQAYRLRSILCVPLTVKEKLIGILYIDNKEAINVFDHHHLDLLNIFASQIAVAIENARLHESLRQENLHLQHEVKEKYSFPGIIGKSPSMQKVFAMVEKVLHSSASIMLLGESGTGKELIARAIHYNGNRKDKKFIALNCAALPDQLLESELFGHRKGAFTGAVENKPGLFETADKGTLFLDEIIDTSQTFQAKLLRVIEDGVVRRLGDTESKYADVRIISATSKNISKEIEAKRFREELYYRLKVIAIELPPLRERKEDIPLLVKHFYEKYSQRLNKPMHGIDQTAQNILKDYSWPGNVRELENEIERAVTLAEPSSKIHSGLFSESILNTLSPLPCIDKTSRQAGLKDVLDGSQKQLIIEALKKYNGNITHTSNELGIARQSLYKMMKRLKIKY